MEKKNPVLIMLLETSQLETVGALSTKATHSKGVFLLPEGSRSSFSSSPRTPGLAQSPAHSGMHQASLKFRRPSYNKGNGRMRRLGLGTLAEDSSPCSLGPRPCPATLSPSQIDLPLVNAETSPRIQGLLGLPGSGLLAVGLYKLSAE